MGAELKEGLILKVMHGPPYILCSMPFTCVTLDLALRQEEGREGEEEKFYPSQRAKPRIYSKLNRVGMLICQS